MPVGSSARSKGDVDKRQSFSVQNRFNENVSGKIRSNGFASHRVLLSRTGYCHLWGHIVLLSDWYLMMVRKSRPEPENDSQMALCLAIGSQIR